MDISMDQLTDLPAEESVDAASAPDLAAQFIPAADLDETQDPNSAVPVFDDRLGILDFFTRKDIMRMTFDTSTRLYQSVGFPDGKALSAEKSLALYRLVFDQTLSAACICLSDDVMKAAFERMTGRLEHAEDPWELALQREFNRVMQQMQGDG